MSDFYRIRPIENWPEPLTKYRKSSSFRTGWTRVLALLERELRHLGGKNVVLQMAITELDIRNDGGVRASARPEHPGVAIAFDSKWGPLQYATDTFNDWQDNVYAIALALEALRKVDRYGVTKHGEQYTGWQRLTAGGTTREGAKALLDSYGGEREALLATHPDHGGNPDEFQRVMEARRVLTGVSA